MDWIFWIVVGSAVMGVLILKRLGLVGCSNARDYLKQGAKVIDVRSEAEFQHQRLPGAINIPLGRLKDEITRYVPDKEQTVLLHCLSGGRSGIGKAIIRRMGYRNAYNLGSFARARKILSE